MNSRLSSPHPGFRQWISLLSATLPHSWSHLWLRPGFSLLTLPSAFVGAVDLLSSDCESNWKVDWPVLLEALSPRVILARLPKNALSDIYIFSLNTEVKCGSFLIIPRLWEQWVGVSGKIISSSSFYILQRHLILLWSPHVAMRQLCHVPSQSFKQEVLSAFGFFLHLSRVSSQFPPAKAHGMEKLTGKIY